MCMWVWIRACNGVSVCVSVCVIQRLTSTGQLLSFALLLLALLKDYSNVLYMCNHHVNMCNEHESDE